MIERGTIAAVSTARAPAAIGAVRVSGEDAFEICDKVFAPVSGERLCQRRGYTAAFGHVVDDGTPLDECVALVYRAPLSYTGENVVELFVHGGVAVADKVFTLVCRAGASPAEAGEFTRRAVLNGKRDLAQAEAAASLIAAGSDAAIRGAAETLTGRTGNSVAAELERLTDLNAALAVWADYPDEDLPEVKDEHIRDVLTGTAETLGGALRRFDDRAATARGIDTVIVGKPNVGKSTLMNLLAGSDRSIVTSVPGTTRDVVTETVVLGGTMYRLSDTAGLREGADEVERAGVELARKRLDSASLIIAVFDRARALVKEDTDICYYCRDCGRPSLAVVNKTDLPPAFNKEDLGTCFDRVVEISANDPDSLDKFISALDGLYRTSDADNAPAIVSERQRECISKALGAVNEALDALDTGLTPDAVSVCVDDAIAELGYFLGRNVSEAVVDSVFRNFCVGK